MDLRLYGRVVWRFRFLVLGGLLVALALAFLTMFRVGPHGVSYRQQKTYRATQTLWLTSKGSLLDGLKQGNLAQVALQYVNIANSNVVLSRVLKAGPVGGSYQVVQIPGPNNSLQPLISVTGQSHAPAQAARIAGRVSDALNWWSNLSQNRQNVQPDTRVTISTITPPRPFVFQGRKLTVPIIIFLSVMIVTLGLAFIFENLRPRPLAVPPRRDLQSSAPDYDLQAEFVGSSPSTVPGENGDHEEIPEAEPVTRPWVPHGSE
jgi:capsular polysaccharide biosynthesis protein